MCVPLGVVVVFQLTVYGAELSSRPRSAPSSLNCTPETASLSAAFAETFCVPPTVAPADGAVSETVGGVVSFASGAGFWRMNDATEGTPFVSTRKSM